MATRVRSYSKINLGLAIGPVRPDGFHGLTTLYQTLDLHDLVTVSAKRATDTSILLTTNHPFVPRDARNTAWKMVEGCLGRFGIAAKVEIEIEKRLPVQGGMGAGSANAAAALLGLERELGLELTEDESLNLAAEVGSDVPLFLLGGAVMGTGRGEQVVAMRDLPKTWCVVAVPQVGVSTPAAFKAWDELVAAEAIEYKANPLPQEGDLRRPDISSDLANGLTHHHRVDKLQELSLAYSLLSAKMGDSRPGTSGILRDQSSEKQRDSLDGNQEHAPKNLAENALLALVRTGIGNDFEQVVFPQYPSLRITKRQLMGSDSDDSDVDRSAIYAALSGSGSALFGLYRSEADAKAAQQRVQSSGVQALLTETLPRAEYWERMFAE